MSQVQPLVVILYQHALLGQGIAEHLRAQLGVEAMIASTDNPQEAVMSTLGLGPAVVIFEWGDTPAVRTSPPSPHARSQEAQESRNHAEKQYQRATELDPDSVPSAGGLRGQLEQEGTSADDERH